MRIRTGFSALYPSEHQDVVLLVFLTPVHEDIAVMKEILRIFGEASGLFTNMDKYMRRKSNSLLA